MNLMDAEELAESPITGRGECERCHRDGCELRTDYSDPGEYQYCAQCVVGFLRRARQRAIRRAK